MTHPHFLRSILYALRVRRALTHVLCRRPLRTTDRPASEIHFGLHSASAGGGPAQIMAEARSGLELFCSTELEACAKGAKVGTAGQLTITFGPEGRVVALPIGSGAETTTPAASAVTPTEKPSGAKMAVSGMRACTGSGRAGTALSTAAEAAAVATASRAALYDGELSAAREADGFGTLTFSNGDVYRGAGPLPAGFAQEVILTVVWAAVAAHRVMHHVVGGQATRLNL
jgi:hypothetical protein